MPTPGGLWLPQEVNDEILRNMGVEGFIHQGTGLLLPPSEETDKIINDEWDKGLKIVRFQPRKYK